MPRNLYRPKKSKEQLIIHLDSEGNLHILEDFTRTGMEAIWRRLIERGVIV